jgi:hypothetical protein
MKVVWDKKGLYIVSQTFCCDKMHSAVEKRRIRRVLFMQEIFYHLTEEPYRGTAPFIKFCPWCGETIEVTYKTGDTQ